MPKTDYLVVRFRLPKDEDVAARDDLEEYGHACTPDDKAPNMSYWHKKAWHLGVKAILRGEG